MGSAVERRIRIQPVERADLRVRLSRRQLRAIGHPRRHACRRVRRRESESGRSQQDCRRACSTERREKTVKLDGTTQVPIRQIGCGAGAGRTRLAQTPHKGAIRIVVADHHGAGQRDINASMSSCICRLYSSDHAAPDFWFNLLCGLGCGAKWLSRGDFLTPALSLRVTFGAVGFD